LKVTFGQEAHVVLVRVEERVRGPDHVAGARGEHPEFQAEHGRIVRFVLRDGAEEEGIGQVRFLRDDEGLDIHTPALPEGAFGGEALVAFGREQGVPAERALDGHRNGRRGHVARLGRASRRGEGTTTMRPARSLPTPGNIGRHALGRFPL